VTGSWFTFALAFVYVVSNIGLFVFYRREHRDEFSWGKHLLIPAIGIIALGVVVYYSVNPLPAWPVSLAPFIVLGWLVVRRHRGRGRLPRRPGPEPRAGRCRDGRERRERHRRAVLAGPPGAPARRGALTWT
jgi:amino acid transporter